MLRRVTREQAARAAWRESSSYAGMNRFKFAGLHLSTLGVHPGARAIVARGPQALALRLESRLLRGADGVKPLAEMARPNP